jgi:hypothetical protein
MLACCKEDIIYPKKMQRGQAGIIDLLDCGDVLLGFYLNDMTYEIGFVLTLLAVSLILFVSEKLRMDGMR